MGHYNHNEVEQKWQQYWRENQIFVADKISEKPKYYVLDMFPYPSGAGLHVGHPLGYIATDIIARYKRAKGFNVLHPMGFDAFGLPAEQYAIQVGVHPTTTTAENTARYWAQMERLGFSYDPECELRTSDASYYKWTQWIFLQLFHHYYCNDCQKACPISELEEVFAKEGNANINAATSQKELFSAEQWQNFTEKEKHDILMNYRLAYNAFSYVNWCPELGTVLANDEVKDGKSERGGHPVERKKMPQWMLRVTAYADRLINGLESVDYPEPIKAMQTHWIGRSEGGNIRYQIVGHEEQLEIFTTRPDTIFGNTYMVVAPEHDLVAKLTTEDKKEEVEAYVNKAKNRSERERQADTTKTGVFTGSYVFHPFIKDKKIPIWISDYVLVGYGTGAIMAVPAHDERDYAFAKKFGLEIVEVVAGGNIENEPYIAKEGGKLINSDFINGMGVKEATQAILQKVEEMGIGKRQVTYRLRDVIWSRQRYWGEPTPIKIKDEMFFPMEESDLPVILPEMEDFKPTGQPESPLVKATEWTTLEDGFMRETNTMPGAAGSSWYFLRYFDRDNTFSFSDRKKSDYWMPVDLYLGGAEHAVGHLLYSRFWTKFLKDIGHVSVEEPYKKLVNQGMIQGTSQVAYRHKTTNEYYSFDLVTNKDDFSAIYCNVYFVKNNILDVAKFKEWRTEDANAVFHLNDKGEFKTEAFVEKMSKRLFNTVNPDDVCAEYGADTLRLYEMFLGPLEMSKPWSTESIEGVAKFIRGVYNLYVNDNEEVILTDDEPTKEEYKLLHKLIKKVEEDIERLAFNTCIPAFMIFRKEIATLKCHKRAILVPFLKVIAPFAPHLAEELFAKLNENYAAEGKKSVMYESFPQWNEAYLVENTFEYPVQINGKMRAKLSVSLETSQEEIVQMLKDSPEIAKWFEGKDPKKVIVVPKRIINVVM